MAPPPAQSALDRIMSNPLVGLSPWILYAVVEGEGRLEVSAALALALAVVVLSVNWLRGESPKMLEFADVVYFGALAIVVARASDDTRTWLELWGGEVANVTLFAIVLGSVLIRRPFTLPYAKEDTPEEVWDTPDFMRVNYLISWVWVGAFAIGAMSGLVGDAVLDDSDNIWTGWIIQTLPLILAAQLTIWYPNRLDAHRDGEIPVPTVRDFLATVTPWLTIIGIVSLSTNGAPDWVGIALIVAGITLTKTLSTKDEESSNDTTARSS